MGSANYTFRNKPRILPWLVIAALIIIFDQITKLWVVRLLEGSPFIKMTSFLNIVLAYNKGAAFSFLASASGWQRYFFSAVSLIAILVILHFIRKNAGQKLFCLAFSLILGGAIGNLIDRLLYGQVTDFIDFHIGTWHWPAFNVADSAITIGAVLFVIDELRRVNRSKNS